MYLIRSKFIIYLHFERSRLVFRLVFYTVHVKVQLTAEIQRNVISSIDGIIGILSLSHNRGKFHIFGMKVQYACNKSKPDVDT